jgi:excisionase family DNA binding protein
MLKLGKKHYYTTAEAALYLGVGAATIRRRISNGELRAKLVGKHYFIDAESLESKSNKAVDDSEAVISLFKRILEHSESVIMRENGEQVFYNDAGIPLMVARFAGVSESVQALGDADDE